VPTTYVLHLVIGWIDTILNELVTIQWPTTIQQLDWQLVYFNHRTFNVLVSNNSKSYSILNFTVKEMDPIACSLCCTFKMFLIGLKMTVLWSKHVAIMWSECIYKSHHTDIVVYRRNIINYTICYYTMRWYL